MGGGRWVTEHNCIVLLVLMWVSCWRYFLWKCKIALMPKLYTVSQLWIHQPLPHHQHVNSKMFLPSFITCCETIVTITDCVFGLLHHTLLKKRAYMPHYITTDQWNCSINIENKMCYPTILLVILKAAIPSITRVLLEVKVARCSTNIVLVSGRELDS